MRKHSGAFSLKKGYILTALGVVLAVVILFLAYKVIHSWEFSNSQATSGGQPKESLADDSSSEERPMIYYNDGWYSLRENLETVLLLGIDKYEEDLSDKKLYRNNEQTDFMMLLILDPVQRAYTAIHLNRDTMTRIPTLSIDGKFAGYVNEQLTLAHTYGTGGNDSCLNAVHAVSEFLYGISVDHYLALTMDAVEKLNDSVGGVTVTLEDDFSFLDQRMQAGTTVTLHGEEALTFVRARGKMEDSSNLARMRRQKTYLNALYASIQETAEQENGYLMKTLLEINDYMMSDCTIQQLSSISEQLQTFEFRGFEDIPGEALKGENFMEFYADDNAVMDLLVRLFYEPTKTKLFS